MTNLRLALTFARRELRGGLAGFRIFFLCLVLGSAAISGVESLSDSFLTGLQDALLIWQHETSKALGGAEGATSFNASLNDFFKIFNNAAAGGTGHGH